jgi:hypothetical protein
MDKVPRPQKYKVMAIRKGNLPLRGIQLPNGRLEFPQGVLWSRQNGVSLVMETPDSRS